MFTEKEVRTLQEIVYYEHKERIERYKKIKAKYPQSNVAVLEAQVEETAQLLVTLEKVLDLTILQQEINLNLTTANNKRIKELEKACEILEEKMVKFSDKLGVK